MITVKIGNDERRGDAVDLEWLHQEIDGRERDGLPVQVVVSIDAPDVELRFRIPPPPPRRTDAPPLKEREQHIVNQWVALDLSSMPVKVSALHRFLEGVRRYV